MVISNMDELQKIANKIGVHRQRVIDEAITQYIDAHNNGKVKSNAKKKKPIEPFNGDTCGSSCNDEYPNGVRQPDSFSDYNQAIEYYMSKMTKEQYEREFYLRHVSPDSVNRMHEVATMNNFNIMAYNTDTK